MSAPPGASHEGNKIMLELINKASVNNTYAGAKGCACGCHGTYAKTGASVTRRVNEINKAIANGEQVLVDNFTNEACYEYTKPNGRVVRVYVEKN